MPDHGKGVGMWKRVRLTFWDLRAVLQIISFFREIEPWLDKLALFSQRTHD